MTGQRLCVLITPSAAGAAWREALWAEAARRGWTVADAGPGQPVPTVEGLVVVHDHAAMDVFAATDRAVIVDTTATGTLDPGAPATVDEMIVRAHALAEADTAAHRGAMVLNAARYHLDLPGLGRVDRPEGAAYRIHSSVAESPLALFDGLPVAAGATANWSPRWFTYPSGFDGTADAPRIDMTGRMRSLLYGPYIRLPSGRWRVDVRFAVDPESSHAPMLFEWGAGLDFCRLTTEIRSPGQYSLSLDRIWPEPGAAELRIWTAHPVFEGRLDFQGCRVTRVANEDPQPLTPTDRIVQATVI